MIHQIVLSLGIFLWVWGAAMLNPVQAAYQRRISLGAGIISMEDPDETAFLIKGQYEHLLTTSLGAGGTLDYIFTDPNITLLSLPEVFWHPLEGDWFINAGLLLEFRSGRDTRIGVRLGTRVPIPLGPVKFVPLLVMDFIGGDQNITIGLGLEF